MQAHATLPDIPWNSSPHALHVELASGAADVEASMRLRHRVFAREMGARVRGAELELDQDPYDGFCHHLLVRDSVTGEVVASTRILTDQQAAIAGGFYSQSEFDLSCILALQGRIMELGRTCVHPDYRTGGAISVLWSGVARFMAMHRFDFLIGCASIPLFDGGGQANAIMECLRETGLSPAHRRVAPRRTLPDTRGAPESVSMPPLLKAYLRLGARICGEPCWDPDFNVADVFVLLDVDDIPSRYMRHFMERAMQMPRGGWCHELAEDRN